MGKMQRNKGQTGERELCKLLDAELDGLLKEPLSRNLDQVRDGGADIMGVPGLAIEVKRQEALSVRTWWVQAVRQAVESKRVPVLAYRQNRRPWLFCLPASLIVPGSWDFITVPQDVFMAWIKNFLVRGGQ